jgi:glycosyltransferase XagB
MVGLSKAEATPLVAANLSGAEDNPDLFLSRLYLPLGGGTILSGDPGGEDWLRARYGEDVGIVACPPRIVLAAIEQRFRDAFRERAVCELAACEPQFSASVIITPGQIGAFAAIGCLAAWMFIAVPQSVGTVTATTCVVLFLANSVFRGLLLWAGADFWPETASARSSLPDAALPIYSILVPLYREANVLPALLRALQALDYPGIR